MNKKIRVLHFSIANTKGGVTQYILNLWKYIDRSRFQFDFVTFSAFLDFEEQLIFDGGKVYHVSVYAEQDKKQFCQEIRVILKNKYDIVHLHTGSWGSFMLEKLAKEENVPRIIIHSHNSDVHNLYGLTREEARRRHFMLREQLNENMATDYWACSDVAAEWLYGDKISKEKIVIMKNAIDLEQFQFNVAIRQKMRKELDLDDKLVIGHIGRFVYQKNHEFLIRVFSEVCQERNNIVLLLIGVGELENDIKGMVDNLGLKNKVKFMGKRNDVPELLQAMDVFCLPSRFEGLPIVLLEAQAADLVCIVSDTITRQVVINDNVNFLPFDIELWKREIEKYSTRWHERTDKEMKFIHSEYNINYQIKKIEDAYASMVY